MPHYPDEVIRYTRGDLLQALADELGSPTDDPRILDAYDQIVSEWALAAEDPDAGYARYFRDGPVATGRDLLAVQDWAVWPAPWVAGPRPGLRVNSRDVCFSLD